MNLFQETKFLMNKYNITANKNYGQNFRKITLKKCIQLLNISQKVFIYKGLRKDIS